jgi:uncharacterized hydantoinase/oxoprolinase family protein
MICADGAQFDSSDATQAALRIEEAQLIELRRAVRRVLAGCERPPEMVVTSGSGEFLARRFAARVLAGVSIVPLGERLGSGVATCATAHALAMLAAEGLAAG